MRARWLAIFGCLFAALAMGLTACGDDEDETGQDGGGGGKNVTIYSSLPLQGASRPQSETVVNGMKLALEDSGNKGGDCTVTYKSLDDATAQAGTWDPGATSANARKAAQDQNAVAYLGEFNSGASAISIPILNQAPLLQISPSNTAYGLTKGGEAADKGEPQKYYPTGKRTYARVVPADHIQAAALATLFQEQEVTKVYILNDKEVYGAGLAANTEKAAADAGLEVLGNDGIDPKAANYRSLADKIKGAGADGVFYSGITANNAVQLFKDLNAAMPEAKLFGPDGVAEEEFFGKIPEKVAKQTYITNPTLPPEEYPPEGQKFFDDYKAKYGSDPEPYAIYGFEAMKLALTAMGNASDCSDKQAVIDEVYKIKGRESVLGTYDIDKDGDTTLSDYGAYTVKGGKLEFSKVIEAQTS